jgi:hypothetical protein
MAKPNVEILNRSPKPEIKNILNHYCYYIEEAVNFGTEILLWEFKQSKDQTVTSLLLFRQYLDILDSLSILVKNGSSDPCKLLLRSLFELNLSIHFISAKHTQHRAYSFLVFDIYNSLKELDRLDLQKQSGIQLSSKISSEKWIPDFGSKYDEISIQKERDRLTQLLKHPEYLIVHEEHDRVKNEKNSKGSLKYKKIEWYTLFEGVTNIESLAGILDKKTLYEVFYRHWSKSVHVTDIIRKKITQLDDEKVFIHPLREPTNLMFISRIACNLTINTFGHFVNACHEDKSDNYYSWEKEFVENYSDQLDHEYISTGL